MSARRSPLLVVGGAIVVALVVVAILAPLLAPYDPRDISGDSLEAPSRLHLLGTNDVGQDILSQVVWGSRSSLIVAVGASALALFLAIPLGMGAGLLGGVADTVAMRALDLFLAVPVLPLVIVVATLVGASRPLVIVLIASVACPRVARVLRNQTRTLRRRGFVEAAGGFGGGPAYVVGRHLVPALGPVLAANFVYYVTIGIFLEAGLAFLGLGDPLVVSWGQVLDRAIGYPGLYSSSVWAWWVLPPGLAITVASFGFALVAVGLEPAFNPRWGRSS